MFSHFSSPTSTTQMPGTLERQPASADAFVGPAQQFSLLARLNLVPAMLMPVLWSAALVWWQTGSLDYGRLALSLLTYAALFLSLATLVHYQDHRRSRQLEIAPVLEQAPTGFQLLVNGSVRPGTVHSLGLICFTIGFVAILWQTYLGGWPLLFFGWLSLLLTYTYVTPPVSYGYRGWGLGEVGILLGFGLIPAISTYYGQMQTVDWLAVWSAGPVSLMAMLAYVSFGFLHWRRDWKLRKITPIVALGPQRALDACTLLVVLAFIAIILLVGLGNLPVLTLMGLAALPSVLKSVAYIQRQELATSSYSILVESTAHAAVLLGALLMVALWLNRTL